MSENKQINPDRRLCMAATLVVGGAGLRPAPAFYFASDTPLIISLESKGWPPTFHSRRRRNQHAIHDFRHSGYDLRRTVKGYAKYEQDTLVAVTNARSKATAINATPELVNDPQAFAKFEAAQKELSGALSRLLVVVEKYPDLKANAGYRDLQAQLEGTENRIAVARNRYISAVQGYNVTVRSFPSNLTAMVFGYSVKANFTVADEKALAAPPAVDFGTGAAKRASSP